MLSKGILFVFGVLLCNSLFSMYAHSGLSVGASLNHTKYNSSILLYSTLIVPSDKELKLNSCALLWCNIQGSEQKITLNSCILLGVDIDPNISIKNNSSLILSKNTVKNIVVIGLLCVLFVYKKYS